MIVSIDDALRILDDLEPKRFYLRSSRRYGHPTLPPEEIWFVHDVTDEWSVECGYTSHASLGEAVRMMVERVRVRGEIKKVG